MIRENALSELDISSQQEKIEVASAVEQHLILVPHFP